MNDRQLLSGFFAHIAQTSDAPIAMIIDRAEGATITTTDGRDYIDLLAGIGVAALGHGHPAVKAAVHEQVDRHLHVMVYGEFIQETQVALATRLSELLPEPLQSVYFTNSGTEAVEGALKLARRVTGRSGLAAFHGGFHGDTLGSMSVGGNPAYRDPFLPLLPNVEFLSFNNIDSLSLIDDTTAAVIIEPVQAEAGVIPPEPGFLEALRKRTKEQGALLIFDEVITGFGRTGALFAFEKYKVVPDVLVLAKALGGGMPLGAFVASKRILKTFANDPPLGHVTTFGGHPACAAAGLASLNTIVVDKLADQAEKRGAFFERELRALLPENCVVDLRRSGLLLGIEMHDPVFVNDLVRECRGEGLVLGWTLHDDTVVRLAPPLIISEAELAEAAHRMTRAALRLAG